MTTAFTVSRAATLDDCRPVRPLVEAHVEYERSRATVPADWAERVAPFVVSGELVILIAHRGSDAVGYASVTTELSTWTGDVLGHLECLFVAEAHRGAGLGRLLIDAAVEEARSRGLRELRWQTPEWNTSAIRFYDRLGATRETKERFALRIAQ
jgi:ribosomal protein S18 acetylase RimI-like enzyme